jgi:hypothetical protein
MPSNRMVPPVRRTTSRHPSSSVLLTSACKSLNGVVAMGRVLPPRSRAEDQRPLVYLTKLSRGLISTKHHLARLTSTPGPAEAPGLEAALIFGRCPASRSRGGLIHALHH